MMDAMNLLLPDGGKSKAWTCGKCGHVYKAHGAAVACCTPIPCLYCGEPTDEVRSCSKASAEHRECRHAARAKQQRELLEKAEKLDGWDGWVHDDGCGRRNGFFASVDDYVDYLADKLGPEDEWPECVFVCEAVPFKGLDVGNLIEGLCDDGYEDMADHLEGVEALEAAVAAFNEANKGVITYKPDYSRAVRVPDRPPEIPVAERRTDDGNG